MSTPNTVFNDPDKQGILTEMKQRRELVKKYNVPGPRYTSYPTAVQFKETEQTAELETVLAARNMEPQAISLYIHVPFCFSLCWYCGCTKIITKDAGKGDLYLNYLAMEMKKVAAVLHPLSTVVQLHMGGGTPTFLNPSQLRRLSGMLRQTFIYDKEIEFSVEIDPRTCSKEHVAALADIGCNRASLGVQDTHPDVQKAIHRVQTFEQTRNTIIWLRQAGIHSINVDLIYGLPKQTKETFQNTLNDVDTLQPDRLAVYSYAHLPALLPSQRLLNENDFPSPDEKLHMMMQAIDTLEDRGYIYIGMDHFSKEEDELVKALENGTLRRNFQGYSTHADTDLYALGMSGISMVGPLYYQNSKDLNRYYDALDRNILPVIKQVRLSLDDLIRRDWITAIMCKPRIRFDVFEQTWNIDVKEYFSKEWNRLPGLAADGLIRVQDDELEITPTGRPFLRNIAMVFDAYLKPGNRNHHSKTV